MKPMNSIAKLTSVFLIVATLLTCAIRAGELRGAQRTAEADRQSLIAAENDWLRNEHDSASLDRILAADFIHPVATGNFLTKAQHIYYSTKYLPPPNLNHRFEDLNVRLYGDIGVVNGIVVATDQHGKEVDRTIFTDVFVYREGRWQAINAQENKVEKTRPNAALPSAETFRAVSTARAVQPANARFIVHDATNPPLRP